MAKQNIPLPHEIFVVDNGSDTPYENSRLVTYRYKENKGITGGINRCFQRAKGDWVVFVSNDVRYITPDSIWNLFTSAHVRSVQAMPLILKTAGDVDCAGMDWVWPGYGVGRRIEWTDSPLTWPTDIVPNITFITHKHFWEGIGGFDEAIRGIGYEDVDFSLRLKGPKIVVRDSVAIHLSNQTMKVTEKNHREQYHRNRRYVINKLYRGVDKWLRLTVESLLYIITKAIKIV